METLVVNNFKYGLDTRRSQQSSVPGVLATLLDAHVNDGAEIEKRKAFGLVGSLPAGCFGLQETPTTMYTFGSEAAPAVMPPGVTYQKLTHYFVDLINRVAEGSWGTGEQPTMTGMVTSCCLHGVPFVVATFSAGLYGVLNVPASTCWFYNGQPVKAYSAGQVWVAASGMALATQFADQFNVDAPAGFVATLQLGSGSLPPLTGSMARVAITGPTTQAFTTVVSDTAGGLASLLSSTPVAAATAAKGASFSFYISMETVGGVVKKNGAMTNLMVPSTADSTGATAFNLLTSTLSFTGTNNLATIAQLIVAAVNNSLSNQGYSATYATISGAYQITITSPAGSFTAAVINACKASITCDNSQYLQVALTSTSGFGFGAITPSFGATTSTQAANAFAGASQTDIIDFNFGATWPVGKGYTVVVTVNNVDYTYGLGNLSGFVATYAMSIAQKVHVVGGDQLAFCAVGNAALWEDQDDGAGIITISDLSYSDAQQLTSAQNYQGMLALLSPFQIQIWEIGADPNNYAQHQVLSNIGSAYTLSSSSLGDLDVLFLSDTGVRSLRVRDSSLNATTFDMGSAIDTLMQAGIIAELQSGAPICSIVEPATGRYWLYVNGAIYVLTYNTPLNIIAWGTYSTTWFDSNNRKQTFTPAKFLVFQRRVYCLDVEGNIFLYGGPNNSTYDQIQPVAELTWLDHGHPKQQKQSISIDAAITGKWDIYASMNPVDNPLNYPNLPPTLVLENGNPAVPNANTDSSYPYFSFPFRESGTHIKMVAVGAPAAEYAVLSNLAWAYEKANEK